MRLGCSINCLKNHKNGFCLGDRIFNISMKKLTSFNIWFCYLGITQINYEKVSATTHYNCRFMPGKSTAFNIQTY